MTLAQIEAAAYDETGYQSTPATAIQTRFARFVNDGIKAVVSEPGMARLLDSDSPITFASVALQPRYVLAEGVEEIRVISERTNNRTLQAMSLDQYRRVDPNPPTDAATPLRWVPIGRVALALQPSVADAIWIKSTSGSDTGTAVIEGIRTGGYQGTDTVTMTGVTAAQFPAFTDWIEITNVYLSASAVGTVTVLQTTGSGTLLGTISIGHLQPQYLGFYLWPTPSGVVTYYVDYRRRVVDLANPTDAPPWLTDFHPLLVDYVAWREFLLKGDVRAAVSKARYDVWLRRLKYATQWASDELPVMGAGRAVGHSRLGGFYPADTWTRG